MSTRFAGLKQKHGPSSKTSPAPTEPSESSRAVRNPRDGKKAVGGYFSPAVSRALRQLALDNDTSIQALLGEAIDDLMRKYDRHPFGER